MNEFNVRPPAAVVSEKTEVSDAITTAVHVLGGIAVGIAVALLIVAGILWASAAGDEEKIDRARRIIRWSLFGLVLALSAWGVVAFFVDLFRE